MIAGHIVVYGDSNCLDSSHMQSGGWKMSVVHKGRGGREGGVSIHCHLQWWASLLHCSIPPWGNVSLRFIIYVCADCFSLLDQMLKHSMGGDIPEFMSPSSPLTPPAFLPERMEGVCPQQGYRLRGRLTIIILIHFCRKPTESFLQGA